MGNEQTNHSETLTGDQHSLWQICFFWSQLFSCKRLKQLMVYGRWSRFS